MSFKKSKSINFTLPLGTVSNLKGNYFDLVFTKYIDSILEKDNLFHYCFSLKDFSLHNADKDRIYLVFDRNYENSLIPLGKSRIDRKNGKAVNIEYDEYINLKQTLESALKSIVYDSSEDYNTSMNRLKKSLSLDDFKRIKSVLLTVRSYFDISEGWIPDCIVFDAKKIRMFEFKSGKICSKTFTGNQKRNIEKLMNSKLKISMTVLNSDLNFPVRYEIKLFDYVDK